MNEDSLSTLYLKDTAFQDLMQNRVFNILLIASTYDAFIMEEDGRVEEQLYFEYVSLNLSSPPRVTRVSRMSEALEILSQKHFDIIIAMPGVDLSETFDGARLIKQAYPNIPIVVLTPFSKEVSRRIGREDLSCIDYVFSWLGNVDLLLAIIKLLEDKLNAQDIDQVGVQMILLVEDSVRFYSSVLPHVYKFLLKQSVAFSTEALNEHEQMLRMRGRPKVMLARDYEEAVALYEKYGHHCLGVITDVSFHRGGEKDKTAGLELVKYLRAQDPTLPIIVESSEINNAEPARQLGTVFLDKNSKKLPVDLGDAIMDNFGFGDFVIKDPVDGHELMRLRNLKDLQRHVLDVPADALYRHAQQSDISRWLYSRALFPLAEVVRKHKFADINEAPAVRRLFFDLIVKYRKMKNRGVVAVFKKDRFDHYSNFARIGQGSLGGKGRGLAFVDSIIKKNPVCDNFDGMTISIPRTVVLCTDVFDEFMMTNRLYPAALSNLPDEDILQHFLTGRLPDWLVEDFFALFDVVDKPLAVRSSSLLEDSHYQPFAGIYSTYMVPYTKDPYERLRMLSEAVKGVYASVFYRASKAYMTATSNVIDQEKMAVIIQEVVGEQHGEYYFPSLSGVGRSLNYYPLGNEVAEDGVAEIAIGLGKYIVDGGTALRFSPLHPDKALQTSTLDLALRSTQRQVYVLPKADDSLHVSPDDSFNLLKKPVQDFAGTGVLKYMVSTYDPSNQMLRDYEEGRGRRVATFNNILRHKALPLAPAIDFMLKKGQEEMQRPVEIEFACNINHNPNAQFKGHMYWLQIRPIIDRKELVEDVALDLPDADLILRSDNALGNGHIEGLSTIVYVRTDNFNSLNNRAAVEQLHSINREMTARDEHYILIGPGRWGSSDDALGIPVQWSDIANARLIVEASLPGYRVEPSQGTHFFHNLTSFGVAYFTIDEAGKTGYYDSRWLDAQPAVMETDLIRVVRFDKALNIAVNGRRGVGIVAKPCVEEITIKPQHDDQPANHSTNDLYM